MSETNNTMAVADPKPPTNAERIVALEAKVETLEALLQELITPSGESKSAMSSAPRKAAPALSGETFTYEGKQYRAKRAVITMEGRRITEADILNSPALQKELVEANRLVEPA